MRYNELLELAGVKRFHDMTATEVILYIQDNFGSKNIKVLGNGVHAYAVMIGNAVYKFWLKDDAYTDFVKYCQSNKSNPFLPRFLSDIKRMPAFFIRHKNAPDYVNYVKMEHLQNNDQKFQNFVFTLNVPNDVDTKKRLVGINQIIAFVDNASHTNDPVSSFLQLFSQYNEYKYTNDQLPDDMVLFIKTLFEIKSLNHNYELDLHMGNFMWRGEQLVILDPLFNSDDFNINSIFAEFDSGSYGLGKAAVTTSRT